MLDTLTFLLEKLFLLAHIKLSSLVPPLLGRRELAETKPNIRRCERDEIPPSPATVGVFPPGAPESNNKKKKECGTVFRRELAETKPNIRRCERDEVPSSPAVGGVFPPGAPLGRRELAESKPNTRRCERDEVPPSPAVGHLPGAPEKKKSGCVEFQRGDLIEVPRTLFTHFGIYLGENRVAHLIPDILPALTSDKRHIQVMVSNTRLLLGVLSKRASVRVDCLEDFAYGADMMRNTMDKDSGLLVPGSECVAVCAERQIGPAVNYSLLWNNCEHFVTLCRYGNAHSRQTERFCLWVQSVIRDQRSSGWSLLLGLVAVAICGPSPFTLLPATLVPFTLWMAS